MTAGQTVAEWVDANYRQERLHRTVETRARIIADREHDVAKYGTAFISRHESINGKAQQYPEGS